MESELRYVSADLERIGKGLRALNPGAGFNGCQYVKYHFGLLNGCEIVHRS
jgi:hypothetical protein